MSDWHADPEYCWIWGDRTTVPGVTASVFVHRQHGGVLFSMKDKSTDVSFNFSLWSEVGEHFKPAYNGLWRSWCLSSDTVRHDGPPHVSDKVKRRWKPLRKTGAMTSDDIYETI